MKTAILGAGGQLGQELLRALPEAAIALGRTDADLTQPAQLAAALAAHRPDVVFNCAAYNQVDRAEDEPGAAFAVNALGVRSLALVCRDLRCVLVHFSTDYVFGLDVERRSPYAESDAPGPVNAYGSSKLTGEHFVRALCPRHFVIRTCGLYGPHGGTFVPSILRRAALGEALRVVDDQECSPTRAADVARAAVALAGTEAFGLYHVTSAGSCSWFEFACAVVKQAGLDAAVTRISSADYGARARRPGYSVLDCSKYAQLGLVPMPAWDEALRER
jgi:dTDP-4-dehydrorhamnose reductase